jgi:hypothetical protein
MSAPATTNPQLYWATQLGDANLEKFTYMSTPALYSVSENTNPLSTSAASLTTIKRIAQTTT